MENYFVNYAKDLRTIKDQINEDIKSCDNMDMKIGLKQVLFELGQLISSVSNSAAIVAKASATVSTNSEDSEEENP